jgi:hypothetical protein
MAVSAKKQEAEFKQQNFFEVCFLIDSPFIESKYEVSMPEFVSEHTLYGIPSLILNQVLVERWRERVDMSPDFFFADTITFNIACDAYRYLNLDKGFVAMDITEFQYKFLKMNGIKFLAVIKL